MVLILLSSPNPMTQLLPLSPRSSKLSPRTPLTPPPSFFAILSPIFTSDDVPQSPTPHQLSPGTVPPETPPPWLLAPQSPASPLRTTVVRRPSGAPLQFSLPRLTTGDGLTSSPRSALRPQRPAIPNITHSYTSGGAQQFRPPPPGSLKRTNTAPLNLKQPSSPLQRSWRAVLEPVNAEEIGEPTQRGSRPKLSRAATAGSVPVLNVRPPSREIDQKPDALDEDSLGDEEARRLSVAMMGVDSGLDSGLEGSTANGEESMEVPFAIDLEEPRPNTPLSPATRQFSMRAHPSSLVKPVLCSVTELRVPHSRSQALQITQAPRTKAHSGSHHRSLIINCMTTHTKG
ncbi:MAG: hypothetical protein LQ340_003457 [Diploschistes diacapsis]|nr:MAG: hypothetical protein LQ340_003457 [Diploschistes diacapsis]